MYQGVKRRISLILRDSRALNEQIRVLTMGYVAIVALTIHTFLWNINGVIQNNKCKRQGIEETYFERHFALLADDNSIAEFLGNHFSQIYPKTIYDSLGQIRMRCPAENLYVRHSALECS
ncbi:hypothetical protein NQ317_012805 [Molorchus minor]|uniref:Uncharacterized protein n=1 Tax=Molorchus minor TaxID=1323400 RepID=A0ABQ9K401_9CUCU|nr:hypothetical protein NQ317_012805 [Molorchus minor]